MTQLRAAFVMEQHLGHRTFSENLRRAVERQQDVDARWVEVRYAPDGGWWERMPGIGERTRGTLRGRAEVRRGCTGDDDVRFFNTQVPAVLGGRRARRRPYVLCTDVTPVQYDEMAAGYAHDPDRGGPVARTKHWLNTRLFRGAAATVPWSTWTRHSLIRDYGVAPDRAVVVPPGVDTQVWTAAEREPSGPMTVLFVGGDLHRKGGTTLLSAIEHLPANVVRLVLVTRTPHTSSEQVTVRRDLQPNSPELIDLYRSSDLFVLPSAAETFGIAAVEAAAAGLPVVASSVGGLPDIVVHGETGLLIPPGDGTALRQALLALAEDPDRRRRMGRAARARAEARFDAAANADRIVALLQDAAAAARRRRSRCAPHH